MILLHGTIGAYTHGKCRCDDCRGCAAAYKREWTKRRGLVGRCGTRYRYLSGCRCDACRAAETEYGRIVRRRRRAQQEAERRAMRVRVPFAPLEQLVRCSGGADNAVALGRLFGVHARQVWRWRSEGVPAGRADELAMVAGFHPAEVWPAWVDIAASATG